MAEEDERVLVGYVLTSRTYRIYNKRTLKVKESSNIVSDENLKQFISKDIDGILNKDIVFGQKNLSLEDNVQGRARGD